MNNALKQSCFLVFHHPLCLKKTVSHGCMTISINNGDAGYQPVYRTPFVAVPSIPFWFDQVSEFFLLT